MFEDKHKMVYDYPPNFSLEEMTASQTAARRGINNQPKDEDAGNLNATAWWLQTLRDRLSTYYKEDTPVIVTSGYRCPKLNMIIGSKPTSAHVRGMAADIKVPRMAPLDLANFIVDYMKDEGFDQVIHEFGRWVHVGVNRPNGVRRLQELTAMRLDGDVVYKLGLLEVPTK